jgi:Fe-Mn family superoxide dismutase
MSGKFVEQKFNIPELKGISAKNIEEHLKLYAGYVKNANTVLEKIEEYKKDSEGNAYALGELQRRFSFEYNGIRNHEYYFRSLEGGSKEISNGDLKKKIEETWESFDAFLGTLKAIALTRGIGWAVLYYDKKEGRLLTQWIDEQHLGHLGDARWILGIDMWEHSFVADYQPSGKKNYIEDFFANLNWSVIEGNYSQALS